MKKLLYSLVAIADIIFAIYVLTPNDHYVGNSYMDNVQFKLMHIQRQVMRAINTG